MIMGAGGQCPPLRRAFFVRYNSMNEKTFYRLLLALVIVCVAVTAAHFAYDVYAYRHCSIIYFIAKEVWGHAAP